MEFSEFADRAATIEAATADTEITGLVAALLGGADDDLAILARYVQGRIFPGHDERTLDIGPSNCYAAIARAAGPNVDPEDVEARVAKTGDVGEVAASYDFGGQRGLAAFETGGDDRLTVARVHDALESIAAASGSGSTDEKIATLFGLFNRCETGEEARYLARLVLSEMRIGVGAGTVRDAIVDAFDVERSVVERAIQVSNDYGLVAETARDDPADLDAFSLEIGRPVQAMLAQAGSAGEAIDGWGEAVVETKYDGARVQIHVADEVAIYSRNMEDVTDPLPDVVTAVDAAIDTPAILDGEVLAVDDDGEPLPFQEVLRRFRRKHDVDRARKEVHLDLIVFDCLHVDGEDLLDEPLLERRNRLEDVWDGRLAAFSRANDVATIAEREAEATETGHEGVMLKNPDAAYTPGRRGKNWLKRKPDVETLDLAVTGAEWGEGRRAHFLGSYELSVRTPSGFETVGKVATGMTDEELESLSALVEPYVRAEDGRTVDVEPTIVFEVGYEEIQHSPSYSSGYALRFPRFVGVRDDLDPTDVDTLERVERLAQSQ
ncbi:MAG: ATP-dependent DNA ligase LigA [Halanaeroarchaeum sp.]